MTICSMHRDNIEECSPWKVNMRGHAISLFIFILAVRNLSSRVSTNSSTSRTPIKRILLIYTSKEWGKSLLNFAQAFSFAVYGRYASWIIKFPFNSEKREVCKMVKEILMSYTEFFILNSKHVCRNVGAGRWERWLWFICCRVVSMMWNMSKLLPVSVRNFKLPFSCGDLWLFERHD